MYPVRDTQRSGEIPVLSDMRRGSTDDDQPHMGHATGGKPLEQDVDTLIMLEIAHVERHELLGPDECLELLDLVVRQRVAHRHVRQNQHSLRSDPGAYLGGEILTYREHRV